MTSFDGALVYREAAPGRHAWWSVFWALLCTAGIFFLLPFSEMLEQPEADPLELKIVNVSPVKLNPPRIPEPMPPAPPDQAEAVQRHDAKPKLDLPLKTRPAKPRLPVSLDLGVMTWTGDFDLNFTMAPEGVDFAFRPDSQSRIFSLDEVDRPPRAVLRNRPVYPPRALRRNTEGFVRIQFTVDQDGRVADIRVVESEPGDLFVDAAVTAVEGWRFEPALKEATPVAVRTETNLYFQIKG